MSLSDVTVIPKAAACRQSAFAADPPIPVVDNCPSVTLTPESSQDQKAGINNQDGIKAANTSSFLIDRDLWYFTHLHE